ncbi:MAG: hypothetical protein IKD88_01060 [Lachnospiraceae bacterium]|nr:hypothetical protein [Lachnospiraceae bacterium]
MYEWSPVTDRIESIHKKVRDRVIQVDTERGLLATEADKANQHVIPIIRRARILRHQLENMTTRVEDDELMVGNTATTFCGAGLTPEWNGAGWALPMIKAGVYTLKDDGFYHNPEDEDLDIIVDPADVPKLEEIDAWWSQGRTITSTANAWQPDGYEEFCEMCVSANKNVHQPVMMLAAGHMTPGYQRILTVGYKALRDQAQTWLDAHRNNIMGDDMRKVLFYTAITEVCDGAMCMIHRYAAKAAEKAAACTDAKRKAELETMAANLDWIAENPVKTYWQALQAAILYKLMINIENHPAVSMGRVDQYCWPYLQKELAAGTIDHEFAQELTDSFFLKLNCFYAPGPKDLMKTTGVGNTYQHTTIGGVDPETGLDATNDITYMILQSLARLSLHDPTISFRVNKDTPDDLWEMALQANVIVGGLPLIQNDEVIIPNCQKHLGFSLYDARNYAIIGCQEITGSGCDYSQANGIAPPYASIHYSATLVTALNDGLNPFTGKQCSIHTGYLYEMQNIEEVKKAWATLAEYFMKCQVSIGNYAEYLAETWAPIPCMSLSVEGCMEQGLDCTWGGAKYTSAGGTGTGLATVADSLSTIEYMCFDKKLCTTRELYDAYMANWEGYEELRQQIIAEVPHFGNQDPYADRFMTYVIDTYFDTCEACSGRHFSHFKAGLYGASDHVNQGYTAWATPDGRKTGEPIADATSPAQGRDKNGPTAVLNSANCYDQGKFLDGVSLNIRIHPTALQGAGGIEKLRDMTKAYLASGGVEAQYNIVSTETLRKAQDTPDEYRNLVVRIAGYSAYFVELSKDQQNDVIARTENTAI